MKQKLEDYIRENEDLRKILLAQEGGIMKYWAEHPDADGTAVLFGGYQEYCVKKFLEKNKWDLRVVWEGDKMRGAALGEMEHLWKEVRYQRVLLIQLSNMSEDIADKVELFTEQYLSYAYKQNRLRRYHNTITHMDIYREIIEMYNLSGVAYKCMEIILNEHHVKEKIEKSDSELFTEFLIRQYSNQLTIGVFMKIRQAVAEMVHGKTNEQCRQMAIHTMEKVRSFSQNIYTHELVSHLREVNFHQEANLRMHDGEWLRDVAGRTVFEELSAKTHSMRYYYAEFVDILIDVGRIWAAQLLVHGIDMHKLEKEVCCILNPNNDLSYYIDKYYIEDLPVDCCVYGEVEAKELLKRIKNNETSAKGRTKENFFKPSGTTFTKTALLTDTHIDIIGQRLTKANKLEASPDDFRKLFSGIDQIFDMVWLGTEGELRDLFKMLTAGKKYASPQRGYQNILKSHFLDKDGHRFKNLKGAKSITKFQVVIDDCSFLLQHLTDSMTYIMKQLMIDNENALSEAGYFNTVQAAKQSGLRIRNKRR